jgi:hypothetical protein
MGCLSRTIASLRIFGDDLNPSEISKLIGKEPTRAEKMGDRVKKFNGTYRIARTGGWCIAADDVKPGNLNSQIAAILEGTTDDVEVWLELSERFSVDMFCGLFLESFNEGLEISAQTMILLGSRGILLDLDIYGNGED